MLIFSVFFLFFFCNISLKRPTCLNHPLRQSKAALFSIFCFISLSGVKPAHDQPPPRLYFLIYPHHFLVLNPKGVWLTRLLWHPLNRLQPPSVNICSISHQHMSPSPPLTCPPLPSACLSPVTPSKLPDGHVCVCVCLFVRVLSLEPTWPRFAALRPSRNQLQNTRSHVFTHV